MKLTFCITSFISAIILTLLTDAKAQNKMINDIPLPDGYVRIPVPEHSFGAYLRRIQLKNNNTVYLYNGMPKANQNAHYAVLDISVGNQDLQQCADAVMRLRAEYLKQQEKPICFADNSGKRYCWSDHRQKGWQNYLNLVFSWCGTLSLEKQLIPVTWQKLKPGDVLIKGGSPGHAVIIVDMARHKTTGNLIFLMAQSYMPAQMIHILLNKSEKHLSPWYSVPSNLLVTPEWTFSATQLHTWPEVY
jgi:hypothetical protein